MTVRTLFFQAILTSIIALYGCGGGGGGSTPAGGGGPTLVSITVTPSTPMIALGMSVQFSATGHYSDNTTTDVTSSATWTSLTQSVADFGPATGRISSAATGTTMISAVYSGLTATALLTVTDAQLVSILMSTSSATIAKGETYQFTATGTFTDNKDYDVTSSAVWNSSDKLVSTVSATGLATSLSQGFTTIIASHTGLTGTVVAAAQLEVKDAIPVSLFIWPPSPTISKGHTLQFTATALMTDATTTDVTSSATWGTSNPAVATIDSTGLVTSVSTGTVTISADYSKLSVTAPLIVTEAQLVSLSISPPSASIAKGETQQFSAIGVYSDSTNTYDVTSQLTWLSSNTNFATIIAPGRAFGAGVGDVTISALASSGSLSATAGLSVTSAKLSGITVTPANSFLGLFGVTQQFYATGVYTDNTTVDMTGLVSWSSSTTSIATISAGGLASPVSIGTTIISATDGILTGTTNLYVRPIVFLPDTGQTQNYTSTWGEDSDYNYPVNQPSYTDNGDETVTDNITGLLWQKCTVGLSDATCATGTADPYNWLQASGTYEPTLNPSSVNICGDLALAGKSNWRLPSRRELMTLLDLGVTQPKISATYFPNIPFTSQPSYRESKYWSSDPIGAGSDILNVNFANGELHQTWREFLLYVRCVSGTPFSPSDFKINIDGTVADNSTGLIWQRGENDAVLHVESTVAVPATWEDALLTCNNLSLGGHSDWRLPNAKELESLIFGAGIDTVTFPGALPTYYWTSTSCPSSQSYIVNFSDRTCSCIGKADGDLDYAASYARCVRGGQ